MGEGEAECAQGEKLNGQYSERSLISSSGSVLVAITTLLLSFRGLASMMCPFSRSITETTQCHSV